MAVVVRANTGTTEERLFLMVPEPQGSCNVNTPLSDNPLCDGAIIFVDINPLHRESRYRLLRLHHAPVS